MNAPKLIFGCLLLLIMAGCGPTQVEQRLERDLAEMKRRLAETERSVIAQGQAQAGETQVRLNTLAKQQADLQASLEAVRVEFQSFNGRLEDASGQRKELHDTLSLVQEDLSLKVSAVEKRVEQLEARPLPEPAPALPPPAPVTPEALYDQGRELVQKKGEYAQGRAILEDFVKTYPDHELTVNALYWIGEAYYGEKKYENAILQFQDVIQKFGDHPKAAAALLKQGLAFRALGDNKNANVILRRVIETFPLSEEAKAAKKRLADWAR